MHKYFKEIICILSILALLSLNAMAIDKTDINNLVENAKALDESEVIIEGEAVGELMNRGNYSWINVNDGTNAIGVWVNDNDAKIISHFGSYKYKGDILKIRGILHRACKEHGGELDLHSNVIEITKKGYKVDEQVDRHKIVITFILVTVLLLILMLFLKVIKTKD